MTKLTVRGLQVELDHKAIVHNIDLEVSVGQWICIIGPNGAGKSSLLKALAGIIP
jgi:iron complex transport system ATP-binding protein